MQSSLHESNKSQSHHLNQICQLVLRGRWADGGGRCGGCDDGSGRCYGGGAISGGVGWWWQWRHDMAVAGG
ncbi:hypothetical protein E3N88_37871 [Mikania micrantha]|uniref:Uncharacterized protein n=1 Tax=Mikania micrantha TaxID=192012 RepID=A0A5N6LSD7_9ASTR|nr:hypothetical protein E3N88_37871 [Mikania micrantha]